MNIEQLQRGRELQEEIYHINDYMERLNKYAGMPCRIHCELAMTDLGVKIDDEIQEKVFDILFRHLGKKLKEAHEEFESL